MTTTKNNEHKKLNFSSEREQSQACLNSAEHEKNQGRKVLNVPNLRFPEFQGEWEETKIGDIAIVVGGGTPDTNTSQYWNGKIQWFTPSEIGRNKYVYNSVRTISEDGLNKSSAKLLPIGTILLSSRATVGECSINKKECTTNQGFQSLIPKENISNEFVYYLIQTKRKDLIRKSCGSTFLEISANEVRKIVVSIPTIKEQDKIAKLLSLLDERIATQNKIIDKLQSLIKGISSRIFASIQGIEYRMGDIVTITNGNSNVQDAVTQSKDGLYPFFDRSEDIKYLPTFLFDKEAIIYPGEGTEFMPRYFKGKFALHQRCYAIFDFNEIINARFLYFYLKTRNSYFVKNAVGSTVPSLRLDTFQKLKVIIPPKKTQHSVSSFLSSMEQKRNVEKKILYKLLNQKQYLLRQMLI